MPEPKWWPQRASSRAEQCENIAGEGSLGCGTRCVLKAPHGGAHLYASAFEAPMHVGPHPLDVQNLLLALRSIDPTARIATPIHDEITVICAAEHAVACSAAMHAWVERTFTLHAAGFAHGLPDGQALISTKWPAE